MQGVSGSGQKFSPLPYWDLHKIRLRHTGDVSDQHCALGGYLRDVPADTCEKCYSRQRFARMWLTTPWWSPSCAPHPLGKLHTTWCFSCCFRFLALAFYPAKKFILLKIHFVCSQEFILFAMSPFVDCNGSSSSGKLSPRG
jgi:hypothetical protein